MTALKPLNLTNEQRYVTITYNVNRFEVYTQNEGTFLTSAISKISLAVQLTLNDMKATFDDSARRQYY
jgi:hypothetical protein